MRQLHDGPSSRRAGIAGRDVPPMNDEPTGYWKTREALSKAASHADRDEDDKLFLTIDDIDDRLFPLAEDILSRRARTVAGLAVQAKAVTLAAGELWNDGRDDNEHERAFIEAVCARSLGSRRFRKCGARTAS